MPYTPPAGGSGEHPDLAAHEALGLAADADVAAHEAAGDPHPGYLTAAEGDAAYEAAGAVSSHAGAADPHAGYQKESEKGAASGYASLDGSTKVPIGQVPTGSTSTTVSLGDHSHAGGSGPTYVKKATDQPFTTTAMASDSALTFTPAADTDYHVKMLVVWQTVLTTVGARFALLLPTAGVGLAWFRGSQQVTTSGTASTDMFTEAMIAASNDDIVTATAAAQQLTNQFLVWEGILSMNVLAAGPFGLRVATETAGSAITVKAKSFLMYQAY